MLFRSQSMTISGGSALPKEDIDRMVKDAEAHAAEDKKRREDAETRNTAEQQVYSIDKLLKENKDKLPQDVHSEVSDAVGELKKALEGTDIAPVKAAQEKLSEASQKIGQALYAHKQGFQYFISIPSSFALKASNLPFLAREKLYP